MVTPRWAAGALVLAGAPVLAGALVVAGALVAGRAAAAWAAGADAAACVLFAIECSESLASAGHHGQLKPIY
jgi:hypothetical protein